MWLTSYQFVIPTFANYKNIVDQIWNDATLQEGTSSMLDLPKGRVRAESWSEEPWRELLHPPAKGLPMEAWKVVTDSHSN